MIRKGECQPEVCGAACCKVLVVLDYKVEEEQKDWLELLSARGVAVADRNDWQVLTIPSVCPLLSGISCAVHKNKPKACVDYPESPSQLLEKCTYWFEDD